MKSKRTNLILVVIVFLMVSSTAKAGECGYWMSTMPVSGVECTCYGIKYNPEPELDGGHAYECLGYCPLSSCKGFGYDPEELLQEYKAKFEPKPEQSVYKEPEIVTPPEPAPPQWPESSPNSNVFIDPNHPNPPQLDLGKKK